MRMSLSLKSLNLFKNVFITRFIVETMHTFINITHNGFILAVQQNSELI
jgi:hypothetical protein